MVIARDFMKSRFELLIWAAALSSGRLQRRQFRRAPGIDTFSR